MLFILMYFYESAKLVMLYGINAFYLAKTTVSGFIEQEQTYTNLSFGYSLTNYPIYAAAKAIMDHGTRPYHATVDLGIGPNIIHGYHYQERSLDGITIPEPVFSGKTSAAFSVMAGVGLRMDHVFGDAPLECGYRFFYLGGTQFDATNSQVLTALKTGNSYANALLCFVSM